MAPTSKRDDAATFVFPNQNITKHSVEKHSVEKHLWPMVTRERGMKCIPADDAATGAAVEKLNPPLDDTGFFRRYHGNKAVKFKYKTGRR